MKFDAAKLKSIKFDPATFDFGTHFGFNLEKLVLVLGFALLSFFIVLVAGFSNDIKFMTVFGRSIRAFFTAGIAAFAVLGILSIQEKYFGIKDQELKPPDQAPNQTFDQNNQQ